MLTDNKSEADTRYVDQCVHCTWRYTWRGEISSFTPSSERIRQLPLGGFDRVVRF